MIEYLILSDEERVSAAWDSYLCQNLMARFVYAVEQGLEEASFSTLWADREDLSYGVNDGFYIGRQSVYRFWVQSQQDVRQADLKIRQVASPAAARALVPGSGDMNRRHLMSPLVVVAQDGQTAKGMWYCPGVSTQMQVDGHIHLQWHYVRYGVDFILEAGQWKLWHLFEGSEFRFEMGHAYVPASGMKPLPDATQYTQNPLTAAYPLGRTLLPVPELQVKTYSIDYGWSPWPADPVPYETFSGTFSYGPEPFMNRKERNQ